LIGFLANGRNRTIIDVPQCPIASNAINAALPAVRKRVIDSSMLHGTVILRDCMDGVLTDFNASGSAVVRNCTFHFSAGSFFQNNPYILESIVSHIETELRDRPELEFLVDAYCGSGVFGIALASVVSQFAGIEIDEKSVALAQTNLQCNHVTNGRILHGNSADIFKNIAFDPKKTCVLLDPPRKGTGTDFLQQLAMFSPRAIVYISCAPDTQARDLQRLFELAQYKPVRVQPFDMFPQTKHVETVVVLEKAYDHI
jgi:23S rRNA (uracil1939-C5)-methyltransferase/tRNA (uracil-5-)-methyltransferase